MTRDRNVQIAIAIASLFLAPGFASAQDAISNPATKTIGVAKTELVPSLIVLNSHGATLDGHVLISHRRVAKFHHFRRPPS